MRTSTRCAVELLEGRIRVDEGEETVDSHGYLLQVAEDLLDDTVDRFAGQEMDVEEWDLGALRQEVSRLFALEADDYAGIDFDRMSTGEIRDALWARIQHSYDEKEKLLGAELLRKIERDIMLQIVDAQWKDHLYSLDHLKEGIGLRGYGQRDPLVEYKRESFTLFQDMKARVEEEMVRAMWWLRPMISEEGPRRGHSQAGAAPPDAAHPERSERCAGQRVRRRWSRRQRIGGGGRRARGRLRLPVCAIAAETGARRRRRRDQDGEARGAQGRPERPVSLRQRQEVQEVSRRQPVMGDMDLKTAPSAIDLGTAIATALTFDDVLLVPQHSQVVPTQVDVTTRFTRNIALNVPLVERGDGHRHRVAPGDRDGAARRASASFTRTSPSRSRRRKWIA